MIFGDRIFSARGPYIFSERTVYFQHLRTVYFRRPYIFSDRTVYFQRLRTVYFRRPYILSRGPYIFSSRIVYFQASGPYIFRQDRIFYFSGPYILLPNRPFVHLKMIILVQRPHLSMRWTIWAQILVRCPHWRVDGPQTVVFVRGSLILTRNRQIRILRLIWGPMIGHRVGFFQFYIFDHCLTTVWSSVVSGLDSKLSFSNSP